MPSIKQVGKRLDIKLYKSDLNTIEKVRSIASLCARCDEQRDWEELLDSLDCFVRIYSNYSYDASQLELFDEDAEVSGSETLAGVADEQSAGEEDLDALDGARDSQVADSQAKGTEASA